MSEESVIPEMFSCSHCGYETVKDFKFCPSCGKQRVLREIERNPFNSKGLISLLTYFFLSLITLLIFAASEDHLFGLFEDLIVISVLFAVIDVGFAIYNGKSSFLFGTENLKIKPLSLLLGGLVLFAFGVNFVADFLNRSLYEGVLFDEFALTYPLLTVIGFQCVYPAIFEELAFRGFLINNVRSLSNDKTAIIVSGFLFGVMHLSFVSLIWLVPIGMLFGYLRIRYNTLWYGIIGHFVYNLIVTLIERGIL